MWFDKRCPRARDKESITGREVGASKQSVGSLQFLQADGTPQAVHDMSRAACGPLSLCARALHL